MDNQNQNLNMLLSQSEKKCIEYFYHKEKIEWFFLEELFIEKPKMLSYLAEILYKKAYLNESYSIIKRNKLIENQFLANQEIIKEFTENQDYVYLESPVKGKDQFKPIEECIYQQNEKQFKLEEFNINETENLIYVSSYLQPEFQRAKDILLGDSQEFGVDIEKSINFTKQAQDDQNISIIQFSNIKDVIIFDMQTLEIDNQETQKLFHQLFLESENKTFIGVGIKQDVNNILQKFNLQGKNITTLIDLSNLYKFIYPKETQCSLSYITRKLTGRNISKSDQISNWQQRPLRRSQLHYAAMDAFIGIHCFKQMQINGQDMIIKFIQQLKNFKK